MRPIFFSVLAFALSNLSAQTKDGAQTSQNNERLRKGLEQFPQADTNKDGILTMQEGLAFLAQMKKGGESAKKQTGPAPSFSDVSYGPHARNKLDFWQAKSDKPTPVVVFIHCEDDAKALIVVDHAF